jgi:Protein of unknown function (DUF2905)
MSEFGKILISLGLLLVVGGVVFILLGKAHIPIGRLPGDFIYRGKHSTFYFPLATCILLSAVLTLVLYVIGRFRH